MKKVKKDKKVKVEKKSKMNGWLTALSVFAGVTAVSGATVLGVYLTGGFNEKIVMPESIAFEYNVDNFNNNQLEIGVNEPFNPEVKQTFKLKITTATEGVTKNKVTLSFAGQDGYNTPDSMGYISNTIIRLPQTVTLNEEFEVELLTEDLKESETSTNYVLDENGEYIDWIKGGISTLSAQSADNEQSPITLKIAVDVPVYKTETQIVNSNGQVTNSVVTNESFTVQSKFIPEKSQYMFSDDKSGLDESQWRVKRTFFEGRNTTAITPVYDDNYTMHFVVGSEPASAIEINGYTYQTAYSQLEYEKTLNEENSANYYISMLENIARQLSSDKVAPATISVSKANVGNYTISRQSQTIKMEVGKNLRLFMNKYDFFANSDYLGGDVYSTSGQLLDGMLGNVAIAFIKGETDATVGANASISIVGGDNEANYVTIDGIRYYKPTVAGSNPRYSFWDLSPIETQSLTIKTVLLIENETETAPFKIAGEVVNYNVNLEITQHIEEALSWTDNSNIEIMLEYDSNGKVISHTISKLSSLASVPSTNIYKDIVFFACFGGQDKSEYIETANKVLGSSGYDYDKSGYYATESGNLTMFAIEGDSITIYESGDFTLYFATVVVENGQYQLDQNGLYQIVQMSPTGVRVSSNKALNDESLSNGELSTDEFTADGEVVNINLGNEKAISVKFTVNKESVPVFQNEYRKGYMTPVILDEFNNDITDLFLIDTESFTTDAETGNGVLEYKLKVKSAVQIENEDGIFLGFILLEYNDRDDKNITWIYALPSSQNVCIYSPVSRNIAVNTEGGYLYSNLLAGNSTVEVEQSLLSTGELSTEITATTDANIKLTYKTEEFLTAIVGAGGARVVITDQKGKTDTLTGKWTFKVTDGDANIISISADGKSFTFKNSNDEITSVTLAIMSADNEVSCGTINFSIQSIGISTISYSNKIKVYDGEESYTDQTPEISKAVVSKYGAKAETADDVIVLADLINFYLEDGTKYDKFSFRFSPQYLSESSLPNDLLSDLFGENGMLSLEDKDGNIIDFSNNYVPQNIRNTLYSAEIAKVIINKNFAVGAVLQFTISDANGAVNTSFDLNILPNISISSENYPTNDILYAQQSLPIANNVINNNKGEDDGRIADLYSDIIYYVVLDGERYVLVDEEPDSYDAIFEQGEIRFNDFWTEEEKEFRIYFQPEGNNYYALNHGIVFTVKRDLKIEDEQGTFYLVGSQNHTLNDFVRITRNNGNTITGFEELLTFKFSDYLDYDSASGNVRKRDEAEFFFDYNIQTLQTNFDIILDGITLKSFPVNIKLYDSGNASIYKEIASNLTPYITDFVASAQTQIVDGVEYLVVDSSTTTDWHLGTIGGAFCQPFYLDYNNKNMGSVFETAGTEEIRINFRNQNSLLAGLGDQSIYFVVYVLPSQGSSEILATLHIPLILSKIGYESVVYEDAEVAINADQKLETALTKPEELITNKIYNEISAGKLTQILRQYDYPELVVEGTDSLGNTIYSMIEGGIKEGGLYTLEGFLHTIKYYPLDSGKYNNYEDLIKTILTNKDEDNKSFGNLTLNHLAKSTGPVYLALEYKIEKSEVGQSQTFYYVLKVIPDTVVEDVIYAYNGDSEYVTSQEPINLEEIFDDYTLHNGEKRFNISKDITIANSSTDTFTIKVNSDSAKIKFTYSANGDEKVQTFVKGEESFSVEKFFNVPQLSVGETINVLIMEGDVEISYNGEKVFASLKFNNEIASVKIGDEDAMEKQAEWEEYISFLFSADYSTLEYNFNKEVTEKIEVKIKHSYLGSASETDLAVVGGEQYYTIVINGASANYKVIFEENEDYTKDTIVIEDDECTITINNGDFDTYDLTILLKSFDETGSSDLGTTIKGILNIQPITDNYKAIISDYTYDNMTGEFNLELLDYIGEESIVQFALYTEQGYLARLSFVINANASYKLINANLTSGVLNPFAGSISIYLNDEELVLNEDYTVDATLIKDNKSDPNYAYWYYSLSIGTGIVVAALIEDQVATFRFVVTFTDGKTFTFTETFNLVASIVKRESYTATQTIVAGAEQTITESMLFGFTDDYNAKETSGELRRQIATIEVVSSSSAYKSYTHSYTCHHTNGFYGYSTWKIQTNYVSATTTVTLTIKVIITPINAKAYITNAADFTAETRFNGTWTQEFEITYSFVVEPSVQIENNYPNPTTEKELDKEFVDDGATFGANLLSTFFGHTSIFGSEARILVTPTGQKALSSAELLALEEDENLSIIVSKLQNASLMYSETGYYKLNDEIDTGKAMFFKRGTYSETSGTYSDNGNDSIVEFTFTYQQVSQTYIVYILSNSLDVKLNSVSNFTSSGTYGTETVNYETIYVDKTNTNNIFAGERLAYVEMSDTMASYANEYYLVFKNQMTYTTTDEFDEEQTHTFISYHASYPINISAKDQSKTLYFDLGYSMYGYEFVGAYLASAFETEGFKIGEYETTLGEDSKTFDAVIQNSKGSPVTYFASLTNFADNLFVEGKVTLANRVQLVYGQDDYGKDILVDWSLYKNDVTDLSISYENHEISKILTPKTQPLTAITRNDGSEDATNTVSFSVKYYFKPEIDIAVTHETTNVANYIELEVNKEYLSMAELFGVHHPTTNKIISASDFASGTTTLSMTTVDTTTTTVSDFTSIESYKTNLGISAFKIAPDGSTDKYLHFAGIENASQKICDYTLFPLGAKNSGDYVLCQITYTSAGYTKTFYVVVKIMPDYVVKFGESTENTTTEEDGSISNVDNIRVISELNGDDYETFTLTGEEGFLSVKHKNGSSTDTELSSKNFTITIPVGARYEATEYNNSINLGQKIFYTGHTNTSWTKKTDYYALTTDADATFKDVKEVIFADQYYMIQGVDTYGFTYKVYFLLQSSDITPSVTETVSLYENGYFDLGVQYQKLSIAVEDTSTSGDKPAYINAKLETPESVDGNVQLVNIQGIEAWLFDTDYADEDSETHYLNKSEKGGYSVNGISLGDQDNQYLALPKLADITIDKINLYDPNDTTEPLEELDKPDLDGISHFATAAQETAWFNGYTNRGALATKNADGDDTTGSLWYIPRITNTDIFKGTNTADLIMVITLKYAIDDDTAEYYDCQVKVNLVRQLNIEYANEQDKAVTQDGDSISVAGQFKAKVGDTNVAESATYINDTLEVLVIANSTATFDMTLARTGKTISIQPLVNVGRDYARTFYISLSEYFGVNVRSGDQVTITNDKNVSGLYYIKNTTSDTSDVSNKTNYRGVENQTITIGSLVNDYIYVEHADLLAQNSYYNVTKYYVMRCKIDGVDYSYQVSRDYIVTGHVYTMQRQFTTEIGFTMQDYNNDGQITLAEWNYDGSYSAGETAKALTLNKASYSNGSVSLGAVRYDCSSTVGIPSNSQQIVKFYIDTTGSENSGLKVGDATIDEDTGTITLGETFNENQYIKILIKIAVSGTNREFDIAARTTYHTVGTLNLALAS